MKPKILLLHGFLGSIKQMEPLEESLKEHFQVYCYDLPGHHGKSFPEEKYTFTTLQQHLFEYIKEFQLNGCFVFGYEIGGYLGLSLEAKRSGTFDGIFTWGTDYDWNHQKAQTYKQIFSADKIESRDDLFADQLNLLHFPSDWKEVCKETLNLIEYTGKHPLSENDIDNIFCKVRIAIGDQDENVSIEESANFYRQLPNGSLLVLPNTKHKLEDLNLELLKSEIVRFAKSL
ncbi:MAG: alpha/beta fold hydrolase [Bacteroidota bacterium]